MLPFPTRETSPSNYYLEPAVTRGVAKVRAVAPAAAILTLGQGFAILDVVIIGSAPRAEEGVVMWVVSPGVIIVVVSMADLVVGHLLEGWGTVDDAGGNAVVGVRIG
jgi:hypothetical protein